MIFSVTPAADAAVSNDEAIAVSISSPDPETLGKMASPTREGLFARFCAAIVESRRQSANAEINRYRHLLAPTFDRRETGRDASAPYNHGGLIIAASAWLAFYVIAAIHHLVASAN